MSSKAPRSTAHGDDEARDIVITQPTRDTTPVELQASDLHGPGVVFCPNPRMPLWSNHPRVFIDVAASGEGACAYCGTRYRLAPGAAVRGGH